MRRKERITKQHLLTALIRRLGFVGYSPTVRDGPSYASKDDKDSPRFTYYVFGPYRIVIDNDDNVVRLYHLPSARHNICDVEAMVSISLDVTAASDAARVIAILIIYI